MNNISLFAEDFFGLDDEQIFYSLENSMKEKDFKKRRVLLIPPDMSRMHSGGGKITSMLYKILSPFCEVDVLPALGTHMPLTKNERIMFFGEEIPEDRYIDHNWRTDVVSLGEVPSDFVEAVSEGLINEPIEVEINKKIVSNEFDLVVSIGQVVPHEVIGMANYSKNLFVGCGGKNMIDKTHMLGAVYGMEKMMGRDHSPVRKVLDYAEKHFLENIPILYIFTVTTCVKDEVIIHGLFIGRERTVFEKAVELSQKKNIFFLDKPIKKVVCWLDPFEFKSVWIGNKAVYRTRMAVEDGGELIILAPGIKHFGEDEKIDMLIRKYGYVGREKILELYKTSTDLQDNRSVAAHLIHGSSDGRFNIKYAVKHLCCEEVEKANFEYLDFDEAVQKYDPEKLEEGFNTTENGEEIFFIKNPALGLWACREKFALHSV